MFVPLSLALLAIAPPETPQAVRPTDAFGRCLAKTGAMLEEARCYAQEENRLMAEQAALLRRLRAKLRQPGPSSTDYPAALAALNRAQAAWETYRNADCEIIDHVFGAGNAIGFAGGTCTIDHYTARNDVLRDLLRDYLSDV